MTSLDLLKKTESDIEHVLQWTPLKLSLLYKSLYFLGYRTEGLDYKIDALLKAELKEQQGQGVTI